MQTPKPVLKALVNLRVSNDFKILIEFQKIRLSNLDKEIRDCFDEKIFRRKQGQASEIAKFISDFEDAAKKLR